MSTPLNRRLAESLARAEAAGQRRSLPAIEQRLGSHAVVDGEKLLDLSSNDYLGLASDPAIRRAYPTDAAPDAPPARDMAASASRLLTGNHAAYAALESDLRDLYGGRAATVFGSGYHANVGVCSALGQKGDIFLADKLCHASLIDGMQLSGARVMRYRHGDIEHLEALLARHASVFRQVFIVTESVFSMDGDLADIASLVALKNRHGAALIVDEAHAVGVFGTHGLGVCEREGFVGDVDVLVGTFGKALASFGAYAVTNDLMRDYLVNHARSLIFTTALPPAVVNWTRTTLARSVTMTSRRAYLADLSTRLRNALRARGVATGGASQIVPAIIGDNRDAVRAAAALRAAGFLSYPIRPPTVPPGTARLRFSLTAAMTWDEICGVPERLSVALDSPRKDAAHSRRDPRTMETANRREHDVTRGEETTKCADHTDETARP